MADTPFGPGTVLAGRFALDDLLDEHGGARFWRATDQILARSVAVHVLPDTDARAGSLLTAARTSALVSDGHLLRVLDAAAEDGVVYVVNEWGYGVSLDRMLAEGPLSPRRAAWVVKEVAEAIATAHRNGVAHGRLLPENVMITEAGTVKLIGFVMDAVLRSNGGRAQRRVTGGEPMSAHESDVINLAALLYAALVGRWPGSEGSKVPPAPTEHGRALRPRQVRAGIPRPLDAICEGVLNADAHPNQTPIETAHEIYAALSDYMGDRTGTPQVGYEATTVLDEDDLAGPHDEAGPATLLHSAGSDTDTGDLPPTGALPVSASERYPAPDDSDRTDADSTQAGTPVFFDEDSGVGWMSTPRSRGLGGAYDGWAPDPSPNGSPDEPDPRDSRPLFADRRPTLGGATSVGGAGTGSMPPPAWGPDASQPPAPDDTGREDGRGRRVGAAWIRLAAVIAAVVIVAVAVVFALNLGNGSAPPAADPAASRSGSPSPVASTPIPVKGVTDFDPEADPPEENPDLAPLAVDGKPGTAWTTVTYQGNPKLGGLKSGVGLLVDLGKPVKVGGVRLTLLGRPTSLQILAAPRNAQAAPSNIEGLTRVASADNAGRRVRLPFTKPVTTRWLVVWLTSVPPVPGGYKGQVAEISVRS